MRSKTIFVIAAALLVVGTTERSLAACDQTCAFINRALTSRSTAFSELKTGPGRGKSSKSWDLTQPFPQPFPGMNCLITEWPDGIPPLTELGCTAFVGVDGFTEADAKQTFAAFSSAIRQARPNWQWFQMEGDNPKEIIRYVGPSRGVLVIGLNISDNEMLGETVGFEIQTINLQTPHPVKPDGAQ
jgi:hypothetical protein